MIRSLLNWSSLGGGRRYIARKSRHSPVAWWALSWLVALATVACGQDDAAAKALQQPPGKPTQVGVSVELVEVSQIVDRDQKVEMEFYVYYTWKDPRMSFDPVREGTRRKLISVDDVWNPDPQLLDELDVNVRGRKAVHVYPDGTMCFSRYYRGMIGCCLDLHEFPLDRHLLEVDMEESIFEADQVVFVPAGVRALNLERAVPHGWKLTGLATETKLSSYSKTGEQFSLLRLKLAVQREPHFYFWGILLPLVPIVATAGAVFWMDPREFGSQVSVGITAMLTIVAYRISIDSSLPPLNYMTRMDYFMLAAQIFVFGAFVTVLAVHVLLKIDTPDTRQIATRLIRNCRWIPPGLLVAVSFLIAQLPASYGHWVLIGAGLVFALWFQPTPAQFVTLWRAFIHPEGLAEAGIAAELLANPEPIRAQRPYLNTGEPGARAA